MPVYCYIQDRTKERAELHMTVAEMLALHNGVSSIRLPGRRGRFRRDYVAEQAKSQKPGCWPMSSDALAVNPEDVPQAREDARRRGVPTDFTADGAPIFTGRDHRKRYCEAVGFFDRSAGYGDAAPNEHRSEHDRKRWPDMKRLQEVHGHGR